MLGYLHSYARVCVCTMYFWMLSYTKWYILYRHSLLVSHFLHFFLYELMIWNQYHVQLQYDGHGSSVISSIFEFCRWRVGPRAPLLQHLTADRAPPLRSRGWKCKKTKRQTHRPPVACWNVECVRGLAEWGDDDAVLYWFEAIRDSKESFRINNSD